MDKISTQSNVSSVLYFLLTGNREVLLQSEAKPLNKKKPGFFQKLSRKKFLFLPAYSNSSIMILGKYINELLFEHNCVVVPGWGGFIARRVPAQVNPVSNKITPPGKRIAFNQGLNLNDGILAKHMAAKESLSYDTALVKIQEMLLELRQALADNRSIHLETVGTFYVDQDDVMTFHPEVDLNVSKEDYGLVTLAAVPVPQNANEKLKQKIRSRVEYRQPIRGTRRVVSLRRTVSVAAAILLVAGLTVAGFTTNLGQNINMSGISTWMENYTLPWNRRHTAPEEMKQVRNVLPEALVKALLTDAGSQTGDSVYQVLPQNFGSVSEARQFIDEMKAQGFSQAFFSVKENGRTWVSLHAYGSHEEAGKHLTEILPVFPQARVMARRK